MKSLVALLFLIGSVTTALAADPPNAQQLAERLDAARRPAQSFEVHLTITEMHNGKATQQNVMRVMARKHPDSSRFDALSYSLEPPADKGKTLLMTDHEIWFFDPKGKHPTQISPQHFRGKLFVADALSTSFSADYDSELDGEETIQDASRSDVLCLRLKMKRRDKNGLTPELVEFWVDKKLLQPIRGQFYTASGKLQRTAYYAGYAKVLGETRPTRVLVVSNTERGLVTDIHFGDFVAHEWPEDLFNKAALERVSHGEVP